MVDTSLKRWTRQCHGFGVFRIAWVCEYLIRKKPAKDLANARALVRDRPGRLDPAQICQLRLHLRYVISEARARLFVASSTAPSGGPDCVIKVFVCSNVTVIDAHQPATVRKTPTNAAFLDQATKPSPDIRILGVGRVRSALPDLFCAIQQFLHQ